MTATLAPLHVIDARHSETVATWLAQWLTVGAPAVDLAPGLPVSMSEDGIPATWATPGIGWQYRDQIEMVLNVTAWARNTTNEN